MSIQTLIQEFKSVVFEKEELEYRDNPIGIVVLPFLDNQHSIYDVEDIF